MRFPSFSLTLVPLLALVAACSSSSDGRVKEQPVEDAAPRVCATPEEICPSPKPDYAKAVAPILNAKCNNSGCHKAGDANAWPLADSEHVIEWWSVVVQDVEGCTMPPAKSPALTPEEQQTIVSWAWCYKPVNPKVSDAGPDGQRGMP